MNLILKNLTVKLLIVSWKMSLRYFVVDAGHERQTIFEPLQIESDLMTLENDLVTYMQSA